MQARYFCKGYNLALRFSMSEYLLIQFVLKIWHIWNSDSNSTYEPVSWGAKLIKQIFLSDCYSFVRIVNFVFRSVKRSKHSKFQLISQKMVWIVLLQRFSFALPSNMSKNVFLLKPVPQSGIYESSGSSSAYNQSHGEVKFYLLYYLSKECSH